MFCQWNAGAEDDLRDYGLFKDDVDIAVEAKFIAGETDEFSARRGTRSARIKLGGKTYLIEFVVEPQNKRPWIQAVELE